MLKMGSREVGERTGVSLDLSTGFSVSFSSVLVRSWARMPSGPSRREVAAHSFDFWLAECVSRRFADLYCKEKALSKEIKVRSSINLSFDELDTIDVSFGHPNTPRERQCRRNGINVFCKPGSETSQFVRRMFRRCLIDPTLWVAILTLLKQFNEFASDFPILL